MKKRLNLDEEAILKRIRKSASGISRDASETALLVGIGDDAAIWRPRSGYDTLLTSDWFLEGTHFLADRHSPEAVGQKCLARAVSDVAAMGGAPRCFLLNLAIPVARTGEWLNKFLFALRATARALNCALAGGDTTRQERILINITVVGDCKRGRAILRSGAKAGDAIFVTGRLGEAAYGLELIKGRQGIVPRDRRLQKHLFPEPRLRIGSWLAKYRLATAMMDLSDGLSSDLPKLCEASGTGARIVACQLPCVQLADRDRRSLDARELALHGGDDYELLFTVRKQKVSRIPEAIGRVRLTQIGEMTSRGKVLLAHETGATEELQIKGWDPFR